MLQIGFENQAYNWFVSTNHLDFPFFKLHMLLPRLPPMYWPDHLLFSETFYKTFFELFPGLFPSESGLDVFGWV